MEADLSKTIKWDSEYEIDSVAEKVVTEGKDFTVWVFEGEMGVGKTTLIKSICSSLGVEDRVSSPTFSLVNEYETIKGKTIYHFDFYRIEKSSEALDIGIYEYFDSGDLCLIEWPQKIQSLLPERLMKLEIEVFEQYSRRMRIFKYE
ncbi:MAG: tRNA (adenosine(37)-N6)-threonylcarbamoyltransferase complex ATPase subunit type 1 TsaE [Bacteroidota bacterium]